MLDGQNMNEAGMQGEKERERCIKTSQYFEEVSRILKEYRPKKLPIVRSSNSGPSHLDPQCFETQSSIVVRQTHESQDGPSWVATVRDALKPTEYTEVFPNVIIGQKTVAEDIKKLRDLGVTHVVNTAMGKKFTQINTNEEYYQPFKIKFYGFEAMDVMTYPIQKHFQRTADFIDQALKEGGKVFVHCHQGRSRSASIVLSYLMLYQGMTVQEAMKTVRLKREVSPNDGFIRRLCELKL